MVLRILHVLWSSGFIDLTAFIFFLLSSEAILSFTESINILGGGSHYVVGG